MLSPVLLFLWPLIFPRDHSLRLISVSIILPHLRQALHRGQDGAQACHRTAGPNHEGVPCPFPTESARGRVSADSTVRIGRDPVTSGLRVSWGEGHSPCLGSQACTQTGFHCTLLESRAGHPPAGKTLVVFRVHPLPCSCASRCVPFGSFTGPLETESLDSRSAGFPQAPWGSAGGRRSRWLHPREGSQEAPSRQCTSFPNKQGPGVSPCFWACPPCRPQARHLSSLAAVPCFLLEGDSSSRSFAPACGSSLGVSSSHPTPHAPRPGRFAFSA